MRNNNIRKFKALLILCMALSIGLCGCGDKPNNEKQAPDIIVGTDKNNDGDIQIDIEHAPGVDPEAVKEEDEKEKLRINTLASNYLPEETIDLSVEDKSNIEELIKGNWDNYRGYKDVNPEMFDLTVMNRKVTLTETSFMDFVKSFDGYNEYLSSDFIDWDFQLYPFTEFEYTIRFSDLRLVVYTANPTNEVKTLSEVNITGVSKDTNSTDKPELVGEVTDFFVTDLTNFDREPVNETGYDYANYTNIDTEETLIVSTEGAMWHYRLSDEDVEFVKAMSTNDLYDIINNEDSNSIDYYSEEIGSYTIQVLDKVINIDVHTIADVLKDFDDRAYSPRYKYMRYLTENNLFKASSCSEPEGLYSFVDFENIDNDLNMTVRPLNLSHGNLWTAPLSGVTIEDYNNINLGSAKLLSFGLLSSKEEIKEFNNKYYEDDEYNSDRIVEDSEFENTSYFVIEIENVENSYSDEMVRLGEISDISYREGNTYGDDISYEFYTADTNNVVRIEISRFIGRITRR